jgi:RNA polymerase sigma-70 factor, ECF subfamily
VDSAEFQKIFRQFSPEALRIARAILRNPEEAEEAVQDAFVRVFNSHKGFRGEARFATWVSRIVINACLTRVQRQDKIVQGKVPLEKAGNMLDDSLEELEVIPREPETQFMDNVIAKLPRRQAIAITLYYFREYDYRQVADALEISPKAVASLLNRGREELEILIREQRKEASR